MRGCLDRLLKADSWNSGSQPTELDYPPGEQQNSQVQIYRQSEECYDDGSTRKKVYAYLDSFFLLGCRNTDTTAANCEPSEIKCEGKCHEECVPVHCSRSSILNRSNNSKSIFNTAALYLSAFCLNFYLRSMRM